MESVAEQAGVSRRLVYKHFANRQDLLNALYERESAHIHKQVAAAVQAETSLADMLRALLRGMLRAQVSREWTFASVASGEAERHDSARSNGDGTETVNTSACQAMHEFDIPEPIATAAIASRSASVTTVMAGWQHDQTLEHAALLEDVYVKMAHRRLTRVLTES